MWIVSTGPDLQVRVSSPETYGLGENGGVGGPHHEQ